MDLITIVNFFYIIAAILFIYGIKMMGNADTAKQGNQVSAIGMLLAVVVTLIDQQIFSSWLWIVVGLGLGGGAVAPPPSPPGPLQDHRSGRCRDSLPRPPR